MEPDDEIYANGGADVSTNRDRPIIGSEQLDIEAYAGLYTGRTKITRLLFIADRCGQNDNTAMKMEALRMAYEEIKKGENTQLFRDVVQRIDGRLGSDYGMDSAWCEMVDRRADHRKEKLENELNAYRTNLIKESIRMGYNDFGDYYYAHGSLADAFKELCPYVSKAEQTTEALEPITVTKLRCAAGLAHLESKKYKLAARKFLEVSPELGNSYNEVIAPQDVATYGGLCALASFDRTELKSKIIDNPNFRNIVGVGTRISHCALYCESKKFCVDTCHYASCLDYLGNLKANLMLDIHLHDHVQTLYDQIRNKALIQYTHPFVSVDLQMMANAFKTTVAGLGKELETLIADNQIQARIDSHNKILYARHADQRNTTFQRVLQTGNEFDRDVRAMLLRANLIKHEYKASRKL
ncbi:hypothetical protein OIU74_007452 [Salix koriyanagi]|uniref:PCI domain-containing protein n=1 Tax=Salix koriyanagi TaxID=2511006 RepID=A0A9Q0U3Q2_9ROSI|nr:hypothetical protein OIU74_007452 [Salix koriyanagi]